jgi:hypothetical protein
MQPEHQGHQAPASTNLNAPQYPEAGTPPPPPGQGGVVRGGFGGDMYPSAPPVKPSKRKLFIIAGVALAFVASLGVYAFAYYLPNKPENVWKNALSNTSKGYQRLVDYAQSEELKNKYKTGDVDGSFSFDSTGFTTDGTFKVSADDKDMKLSADFGIGVGRMDVSAIIKQANGSEVPDVYLKVSGITGLGNLAGLPMLDTLNNRWIAIDHTFFDSFVEDGEAPSVPKEEDITEVTEVVGRVSDKYIFTTNKEDAAFTMRKYVGKEKQDGKDTMHYKVSPNKDNLKRFIEELATELDKTKLNDWVKETNSKSLSELLELESAKNAVDNLEGSEEFDAWVNTDTRLLHKIKFTDANQPEKNFAELVFNYSGGAEMPIALNVSSKQGTTETTGTFGLTVNTDTDQFKVKIDIKENTDGAETSTKLDLTAKPGDDIDADVPKDAVSLVEAMDMIGLGDYFNALIGSLEASLEENFQSL